MTTSLQDLKNCPKCSTNWFNGDIFDKMLEQNGGNVEKAKQSAAHYGWTETNKKFFSRLVGIYDYNVDATIEWQCPDCESRWCRYTEKEIEKEL